MSASQVLAADPQVIILQDQAAGASLASLSARPGWAAVSAVASRRVVAVDPNVLSDPGPDVVVGLRDLALALHPGIDISGFIPIAPPAS